MRTSRLSSRRGGTPTAPSIPNATMRMRRVSRLEGQRVPGELKSDASLCVAAVAIQTAGLSSADGIEESSREGDAVCGCSGRRGEDRSEARARVVTELAGLLTDARVPIGGTGALTRPNG
jgi:hypothetical protein